MTDRSCCGAAPTLTWRTFSNGSVHAVYQCGKCLAQVGGPIPKSEAPASLPQFAGGHGGPDIFGDARREGLEARFAGYLKSGKWRGKTAAATAADLADIALGKG